jgi:hypothetical protein
MRIHYPAEPSVLPAEIADEHWADSPLRRNGWEIAPPETAEDAAGQLNDAGIDLTENVAGVLEQVGDNPALAAAALVAEQAGLNRTTLVDALTKIAAAPPADPATTEES